MTFEKMTLRDLGPHEISNKRVLVRVDYNVPLDDAGRVRDDARIRATLPTLTYLRDHGGRVALLSHLGRPKGPNPRLSLAPVAERLSQLLGERVGFVESTVSDEARAAIERLPPGGVCLLENTRFLPAEETNDLRLARELAEQGDVFVNDAFAAAHRAHVSTEGVARFLQPAVAGFLMEREIQFLGQALHAPKRPFVGILGGAKLSGKVELVERLLERVDRLCVGGAIACVFFQALGLPTGESLVEPGLKPQATRILELAGAKLLLPDDVVVADRVAPGAAREVRPRNAIPEGWAVVDIGPAAAARFRREILTAGTVLWNGPLGVFEIEEFAEGTFAVAQALAEATEGGTLTVVGGGDSAAAAAAAGVAERVSHVSTGGGASLEFLAGKTLPAVAALTDRTANRPVEGRA